MSKETKCDIINEPETRIILIANPEKNKPFFEDARKTKQSQIACFSALHFALWQLLPKFIQMGYVIISRKV